MQRLDFVDAVKAAILDGSSISRAWQEELGREAASLRQRLGRPPGLAVVIVGDRPDSKIYVQRKLEACARVLLLALLSTA